MVLYIYTKVIILNACVQAFCLKTCPYMLGKTTKAAWYSLCTIQPQQLMIITTSRRRRSFWPAHPPFIVYFYRSSGNISTQLLVVQMVVKITNRSTCYITLHFNSTLIHRSPFAIHFTMTPSVCKLFVLTSCIVIFFIRLLTR